MTRCPTFSELQSHFGNNPQGTCAVFQVVCYTNACAYRSCEYRYDVFYYLHISHPGERRRLEKKKTSGFPFRHRRAETSTPFTHKCFTWQNKTEGNQLNEEKPLVHHINNNSIPYVTYARLDPVKTAKSIPRDVRRWVLSRKYVFSITPPPLSSV